MADDLTLGISNLSRLTKTDAAPNIKRLADMRFTDGTVWDPGSGPGYYAWNGTIWEFLGTDYDGIYSYLFGSSASDTPTGWRDQNGNVAIHGNPSNAPTWAVWQGDIYQLSWGTASGAKEAQFEFHVQHDYKPGSDMYIHVHWSTAAAATGDVKWYFDVTYASGYESMVFATPITTSVVQTAEGTAYMHHIAEIQLSSSTPTASQLDSSTIEVDGLIIVRLYRDSGDADDTLSVAPFVHFCDLHYQVDRFATLNRNPNFYA